MEELLLKLWALVANGDPHAVCTFVFVLCFGLMYITYKQFKIISHLNEKIANIQNAHLRSMEKVLGRYTDSNAHLSNALNEIRVVLATLQRISHTS